MGLLRRLALTLALAAGADVCDLHERRGGGLVARDKACEATLLDAEFSRYEEHDKHSGGAIARALTKHKFALPHRDRFPELLTRLGLNGSAVEIGVREGVRSPASDVSCSPTFPR